MRKLLLTTFILVTTTLSINAQTSAENNNIPRLSDDASMAMHPGSGSSKSLVQTHEFSSDKIVINPHGDNDETHQLTVNGGIEAEFVDINESLVVGGVVLTKEHVQLLDQLLKSSKSNK